MYQGFLLSLSVTMAFIWLVVPAASIAGAYSGSRRRGKAFYSQGELVALLLLISIGSLALLTELMVTGALTAYLSPWQYVTGPSVSQTDIFLTTLTTWVILYAIFILISFKSWKRGRAAKAA